MPRYKSIPEVVDAIQVAEDNLEQVIEFLGGEGERNISYSINYAICVVTLSPCYSVYKAKKGDWIIRHANGGYSIQLQQAFPRSYELLPPEVESLSELRRLSRMSCRCDGGGSFCQACVAERKLKNLGKEART